jgi:hypothetical protein
METLLGKAYSYDSENCVMGIRMLDLTERQKKKKNTQAAEISFLREIAGD